MYVSHSPVAWLGARSPIFSGQGVDRGPTGARIRRTEDRDAGTADQPRIVALAANPTLGGDDADCSACPRDG
jgi:hypothetical protein